MTLVEYGALAEVVIALGTLLAVGVSIWIARRTARELGEDRRLRQAPFVAFEPGGWRKAVEFVRAGKYIPGIDPKVVALAFPDLPEYAESVRLKGEFKDAVYGHLRNLGVGPALDVEVCFIPLVIELSGDVFVVDEAKRREALYSRAFNTLPADPSHIMPGESSRLTRLPTFYEKDTNKKLTRVDGVLRIRYTDVARRRCESWQTFHSFGGYRDEVPNVHITFADILGSEPDLTKLGEEMRADW